MDMFDYQAEAQRKRDAPLSVRMRPTSFETFVGQEHLVGKGRMLRKTIEAGRLPSIVLWGPPGSGKTTLASIIASAAGASFSAVSAVTAGVADLRRVIESAKEKRRSSSQKTILFIDEIHRFNKGQQDAILPYVEDGTVTLIGATTENPSFEVTSPLLSRARVLTMKPLTEDNLRLIVTRALVDKLNGLGSLNCNIDRDAEDCLISMSQGDARIVLNTLEIAALSAPPDTQGKHRITLAAVEDALQQRTLQYDRAGEQHYDTISALHKAMRGSDPDAALYWLARMLESGEDPLYVARRMVRFASEDVGLADPQALVIAMAAQQAVHFIGMPEGNLALAEAAVYLATAPKSNSLYTAYSRIQKELKQGKNESVPLHLRNAVTPLMKDLGYGKDYKYAHDYPGAFTEQQYLPGSLKDNHFYSPSGQGYEKLISERLRAWWREQGKAGDTREERP